MLTVELGEFHVERTLQNLSSWRFTAGKYELPGQFREAGRDMKVILGLSFVLLTAASVLAFGRADLAADVTAMVHRAGSPTEPATMLLWGSVLLALAGVVRRFVA